MVCRTILYVLLLLAIAVPCAPVSAAVLHVSTSGTDENDGLSWGQAMRTVQVALDAAEPGIDEVWVAAGAYYENIVLTHCVGLYGGFQGTETSRDQRDWATNATVLNGRQKGSVVTCNDAPATTRIDGFTITGGTGNGTDLYGGGIDCHGASVFIVNNRIAGNSARQGGGISCRGGSPQLLDNVIEGNSADDAAGVHLASFGGMLARNRIQNNTATYKSAHDSKGGGIVLTYGQPRSRIWGNVVCHNEAGYGGGIYCDTGATSMINNLIFANRAYNFNSPADSWGGGMYLANFAAYLAFNTVAGNTAPANASQGIHFAYAQASGCVANVVAANASPVVIIEGAGPTLHSNCFYSPTCSDQACNIVGTPALNTAPIYADPLFIGPSIEDFHLAAGSPCIDLGDAEDAPGRDLDGYSRPKDGDGDGTAAPDIGCYECPPNYTDARDIRTTPEGTAVGIGNAITTADFGAAFYVESPSRNAGVRILGTSPGTGKRVAVEGSVALDNGEPSVAAAKITDLGIAAIPLPLLMTTRSLATTAYWSSTGVELLEPNSLGLLVKVAGELSSDTSGRMVIRDGFGLVPCDLPAGVMPDANWAYVAVVGVSACELLDGEMVPVVRARTQADVVGE